MAELSATGHSGHPALADFARARRMNQWCGTALTPWDMAQLDDEATLLIDALTVDLPAMRQASAPIEAAKEAIRKQVRHG